MSRVATIALWVLALAARGGAAPAHRGVSLGLFSEDAGWSYGPLLEEIATLGAGEVELVIPLYQSDVAATEVGYHPRFSPPIATIRRTMRQARALGLGVVLFPIVRLVESRGPDEWRGTLRPRDRAAWFASYGARIEELAALAAAERAAALTIGSELSTLDREPAPWIRLVARVRARYRGPLVYSANWDRFDAVGLWDLVDRVGVCAYFPLATPIAPMPDEAVLVAAWRGVGERLAALAARTRRPVLLTELGYRSQPNALSEPWDERSAVPADARAMEAQRRGFAAFRAAFAETPAWLDGFYVWSWYGWGGTGSKGYTPRGKPALGEVRRLLTDRKPATGDRRPATGDAGSGAAPSH